MDADDTPFVSLVVLGYYIDDALIKCMKSLTAQDYPDYEIVLVWSAKPKDFEPAEFLKNAGIKTENISIYAYSRNLGYAEGNNIGVKKARGEMVFILNPDIVVEKDFLTKMVRSYKYIVKVKGTDRIIVGPRINNLGGIIEYSRRTINFLGFSNMDITKSEKIRRTMIISGCAFLMKREHYLMLGGFDKDYFMYHEDIDFSLRAIQHDFFMYIDNSIILIHLKDDKGYRLTPFKYYYHERNRILMTMEHTRRKFRMFLCHILMEPLHLVFAVQRGFIKQRLDIYRYFIRNRTKLFGKSGKESDILEKYTDYDMSGIFNEVPEGSILFKLINFYARLLYALWK